MIDLEKLYKYDWKSLNHTFFLDSVIQIRYATHFFLPDKNVDKYSFVAQMQLMGATSSKCGPANDILFIFTAHVERDVMGQSPFNKSDDLLPSASIQPLLELVVEESLQP